MSEVEKTFLVTLFEYLEQCLLCRNSGDMMVQLVVLSPHRKKVLDLSVWNLHVLLVPVFFLWI